MIDGSDRVAMNQQIVDVYVQTAKQHFNQEEVDAQIAFYSSEVGQNIIDKQPSMMKDYMAQVMPIVMESTMKKSEMLCQEWLQISKPSKLKSSLDLLIRNFACSKIS